MPVQTELQLLSTYLTGRLNQLIAIVNTKGTTAQALTAIRNGVPLAGDDLLKLYNLAVGLQTNINTINGLLLSDDTTLDELQEVVDFIKANRDDLDNLSIANIAGLQDALDAKLSLAGGIMSGNIVTDYFIASFNNLNLRSGWGTVSLHNEANPGIPLNLVYNLLSASRSVNFQDKDITVAGLDDIATAIAALVDSSPAALDTLNELAAALGDDPNFATTITGLIASKLSLSGGAMSGDININTQKIFSTSSLLLKSISDSINLINQSDFAAMLNIAALTANRNIVIQNKDHTIAGLDDIKNLSVVLTTTNSSHTGNTNETALYISSLIPGGTITTGDLQEIETQVSKLNTASSVTINVYTNDTPDLVNSGDSLRNVRRFNLSTSHLSVTDKHTYKMSSASSGIANISPLGDLTSYSDSGSQTTRTIGARTAAFYFATPEYVIVTATLIDTSDTVTLEFFNLFRKRI